MPRQKGKINPRKCHPREETQKGGEESREGRRSEKNVEMQKHKQSQAVHTK